MPDIPTPMAESQTYVAVSTRTFLSIGSLSLQSSEKGILNLPNEITLMITNRLPRYSTVLLGLTCKNFYNMLSDGFFVSLLDHTNRLSFAITLQKDFPDLLACRSCGLLYRWKSREPDFECPHYTGYGSRWTFANSMPAKRLYTISCIFRSSPVRYQHTITRELVDLVLRHSLMGPEAGRPVSTIDLDIPMSVHHVHKSVKLQVRHHVIDQELISRAKYTTSIDPSTMLPDEMCYSLSHAFCVHTRHSVWSRVVDLYLNRKPHSSRKGKAACTGADCKKCTITIMGGKCGTCATEYRLRFTPDDGDRKQLDLWVLQNYGGLHADRPDVARLWAGDYDGKLGGASLAINPGFSEIEQKLCDRVARLKESHQQGEGSEETSV